MSIERPLFDLSEFSPPQFESEAPLGGQPRLRIAQRHQVEFTTASLDELLDADHPARAVWEAVAPLDLSCLTESIQAVQGHVGRNATDPRILLALWVYATLEGVASARALDRLCVNHVAYRWICGKVTVNHRLLSEFRAQHAREFKTLLCQLVASLLTTGLVTMHRVAQDGMRTRASAGTSSFRSRPKLEQALIEAQEQIETLERLSEEDPQALSDRQQGARKRAASERAARIKQAIEQVDALQKRRDEQRMSKSKREQAAAPRASTSDPEATKMKFADGGCRPGYNVQFATDTASGIILGVDVSSQGSDQGLLQPMFEQLQADYGRTPREYLVDGGFVKLADIDHLETRDVRVFAPVTNAKKKLAKGQDPYLAEKRDTPGMAAWRARMGSEIAQGVYKLRCQTAEWVNAQCRNHNLRSFPTRGKKRCLAVTLLHALTHNLLTALRLVRAAASAA